MAGLVTPCCQQPLSPEAFLAAVRGYASATRSFSGTCPGCGEFWEFQARGGELVFGFIYAAGSPHFEGLEDVAARGLRVHADGGASRLQWDGHAWPPGTT